MTSFPSIHLSVDYSYTGSYLHTITGLTSTLLGEVSAAGTAVRDAVVEQRLAVGRQSGGVREGLLVHLEVEDGDLEGRHGAGIDDLARYLQNINECKSLI